MATVFTQALRGDHDRLLARFTIDKLTNSVRALVLPASGEIERSRFYGRVGNVTNGGDVSAISYREVVIRRRAAFGLRSPSLKLRHGLNQRLAHFTRRMLPVRCSKHVEGTPRRHVQNRSTADVELDVPVGCTVQVQTRDGDISIAGVAAAYAGSQNGDISIEHAARLVEAGSVGGSISLKDSSGRINLSSAGGGVSVVNTRPVSPDDSLEVGTVSGDIELEGVSNARVVAKTVNGNVTMTGPLAHGGHYGFTTMSGDVNLELPEDASFQLNAKISESKELVSDFP